MSSNGVTPIVDYGYLAQQAAEKHLAACQEAFWAYEERGEEIESPASAPFCGCDTCLVREILYAAWPQMIEAAKEELRDR